VPHEVLEAIRREVIIRAQGRCEYCLYPEAQSAFSHQVDHIVSRKHGGSSSLDNLALCCIFCNRYKGSDIAAIHTRTRKPVRLFHPRLDRWADHFRLSGAIIEGLTAQGEVTARLLRFNQAERVAERAFTLSALIPAPSRLGCLVRTLVAGRNVWPRPLAPKALPESIRPSIPCTLLRRQNLAICFAGNYGAVTHSETACGKRGSG
jgi:hypothetical protein